jgi:hypothetical protein
MNDKCRWSYRRSRTFDTRENANLMRTIPTHIQSLSPQQQQSIILQKRDEILGMLREHPIRPIVEGLMRDNPDNRIPVAEAMHGLKFLYETTS